MQHWRIFAGVLVALYAANAGAATDDVPYFGDGVDIGISGSSTDDIVAGDLNADGLADIVSVDNFGPARYYLNNGTSDPFAGVTGLELGSGDIDDGAALGDVNGDGHVDIVARRFNSSERVYLNNGNPADPFAGVVATDIGTEDDASLDIKLADVDADGYLDVLVANTNTEINRLYLNNRTSDPFAGVTPLPIGLDEGHTNEMAVADIDNDGDIDVVVVNSSTSFPGAVQIHLNQGTADPFAGAAPIEIAIDGGAYDIAAADVNGDGLVDLVVRVAAYESSVWILINDGSAVPFSTDNRFELRTPTSEISNELAIADMNADTFPDIVVTFWNTDGPDRIQLFLNTGTANPFADRLGSDVTASVPSARAVAIADFNLDGNHDILLGTGSLSADQLYFASLGPDPYPPQVAVTAPEESVMLFDTVTLAADAGDNIEVAAVTFLANDLVVATVTAAPFTAELDTRLLTNGLAGISAVAVDPEGNIGADSVSVFIANIADQDGDFIPDQLDNCIAVANTDQRDTDADNYGNVCDADLNDDCLVNAQDLGVFRSLFFSADEDADFNGDDIVNVVDLGILKASFFLAPGPSGLTTSCIDP